LNIGDEKGPDWIPAETDVSIRPDGFGMKKKTLKSERHKT
jgi:hypothetical protein